MTVREFLLQRGYRVEMLYARKVRSLTGKPGRIIKIWPEDDQSIEIEWEDKTLSRDYAQTSDINLEW